MAAAAPASDVTSTAEIPSEVASVSASAMLTVSPLLAPTWKTPPVPLAAVGVSAEKPSAASGVLVPSDRVNVSALARPLTSMVSAEPAPTFSEETDTLPAYALPAADSAPLIADSTEPAAARFPPTQRLHSTPGWRSAVLADICAGADIG